MLENWYYIFAMFTFQDSSYFSCQGGGGASQFSGKETLHASTCLNCFCHFHGIICPTHFFLSFFFCGSRSTTNHLFCSEALSLVINIMHAYLLVDMLSHLLQ